MMMNKESSSIPKIIIPADIGLESDEEFVWLCKLIDEWGWNYEHIVNKLFSGNRKDDFVITREIVTKYKSVD
jgi:hypothetical protein